MASLTATILGCSARSDQGVGRDRGPGPARYVVDDRRQPGRVGDRGEVRGQRVLGGLAVVRGDHEQAVRAGLLGLPGELEAVRGDVRPDPGDDRGPAPDRLPDHPDQARFLLVGRGRRLTGGAVDDQALVAHVVHEVRGQPGRAVVVDRAVQGHRGDHGRHQQAERRRGGGGHV